MSDYNCFIQLIIHFSKIFFKESNTSIINYKNSITMIITIDKNSCWKRFSYKLWHIWKFSILNNYVLILHKITSFSRITTDKCSNIYWLSSEDFISKFTKTLSYSETSYDSIFMSIFIRNFVRSFCTKPFIRPLIKIELFFIFFRFICKFISFL